MKNPFFAITNNNPDNNIFYYLKKKNNFNNFLCAVSGGPDSSFLLFLLLHIQKCWNINIYILHCQHFWQPNNFYSFKEIYKISFLFKNPIYLILSEKKLLNETNSRNWRHDAFFRASLLNNCKILCTGHTATDRIETSFFNLIRGTSFQGISTLNSHKKFKIPLYFKFFMTRLKTNNLFIKKSIKIFNKVKKTSYSSLNKNRNKRKYNFNHNLNKSFIKPSYKFKKNKSFVFFKFIKTPLNINIARPLLNLHRNDIILLSRYMNLPIFLDLTNLEFSFSRNRLRLKIFPRLRYYFNKRFDLKFYQYLTIVENEDSYLFNKLITLLKNNLLNKYEFNKLSTNLQRRYLILLFQHLKKKTPSYIYIEFIRKFILL